MITWSLQIFVIAVVMLIHLSDASIIVEYANGSRSFCNQTHDSKCTDLQSALSELTSGSKLIIGAGDNYTLSYNDIIYGLNSIVIVGEGSDNTLIACNSSAGLAFINTYNITIANLTLKKCGAWRNSTTQNVTYNFTYIFRCGLYFLNCSDVTIYDIILTDGRGTGVMMYDVLGTVTIAGSQFLHNRVPTTDRKDTPGGGGLYIEFTYCLPDTTNFNACTPINQTNAAYFINNCKFINNIGTTINTATTKYIFPIGSSHQQFGRGGGLSIYLKGNAINNSIIITNCTINDNMAVWGGGILVDLLDSAQNNYIVITDVNFSNNSVYVADATGGGALRINYFPQVKSPSNIINVTGCRFDSNSAYFGGAVSLAPKQEQACIATNRIYFNCCVWENNRAHIGSAVDLSSYFNELGAGSLVFAVFENCSFIRNGHIQISNKDLHIGMGTFHSDGISFSFEGDNYFIENNETALMIIHARAEFKENSSTEFVGNLGYRGGAMALIGNTWLNMESNTKVLFKNNSADDKGGAIYYVSAGVRDVNSRSCFIRYFDYMKPPEQWATSFTFIDNFSRNPGHAIYCTTLVTCSWSNTSIVLDPETLKTTFRWKNVFNYPNNTTVNTIATDPASVSMGKKELHIAPGNLSNLNLSVIDDTGATRNTVFLVHSDNESVGNLASTSTYIADDQIKVLGSPGKKFPLHFYTTTTKILSFKLNATLSKCPPGYYFPKPNNNLSQSHDQCLCSVYDSHQRYDHIPYCKGASFQAVLQPQFWAGYIYIHDELVLVTGKCPAGYCYTNGNKKLTLPSEADCEKINELICSPKNRSGILCGRCENGSYIYANKKDYRCGKCPETNGYMLQFFAKFLPLLIFLLIIIILDINLASGPLNTFVFFAQILPYLDLYAGGQIPINDGTKPFVMFYQFCYGIFNLQYFESLDILPGWCTVKYQSALSAAAMGYVDAFCPLVVIFLVWLIIFASDYCVCCGNEGNIIRRINTKFRQLYRRIKPNGLSLSESFFRGLVTFILLSYTKFTLVTLTLLTPAYLHGPGGKTERVVARLDGTLDFFDSEHRQYAEPAIFVLVFIILLPLVLFAMYPWMCNCLKIPTHKMMNFFDTLNGAFREEYKLYYFSLLYFVYRIVLVAIFTFISEAHPHYVLQQIFAGIVLMLHAIAQPYKNKYHNILDLCILALIPTVISISFYQLFNITTSDDIGPNVMVIQIILLYIPLIYLVALILYKLYQRKRRNGYERIDNNPAANDNAFVELTMTASMKYQAEDQANHDNKL